MRQHEVHIGIFVRLLYDWLDIPKGAVGTIATVEALTNGSWFFTIFWEPHRPLSTRGRHAITPKSGFQSGTFGLRLWEEDLPRFEIISEEEKDVALLFFLHRHRKPTKSSSFMSQNVDQLPLPFGENYQLVRSASLESVDAGLKSSGRESTFFHR